MRQTICPECGGPVVIKKYRHVENVGRVKVNDETAIRPFCTQCGNVDLTLNDLAGYERRAAALVLDKIPRANGAMLRYARKALGITQAELAKLIGHEPETISRWETDKRPIERAEQLALVALLDQVECHGLDIRERLQLEASGEEISIPTELEVIGKKEAA